MSQLLELAQAVLRSQPFSTFLGAEVEAYGENLAVLKIPIKAELKQQNGFVHGGVLSYAADNALTFAGGLALGSAVVTSEFKINYTRPAVGELLLAKAKVIYAGKNQAVCTCELFMVSDTGEKLCAIAQGTIARLGEPPAG